MNDDRPGLLHRELERGTAPGRFDLLLTGFVVALVLIAGACGYYARPAIDATIEARDAYGEDVDRTFPWDPDACAMMANEVAIARIVRAAGGRKAPYIDGVRSRIVPGLYDEQIIREVSDAWDRGVTGPAFQRACIQELRDHFRRQQQQKEHGT